MLSNRFLRRLFVSAAPKVALSISGSAVAAVQIDWNKAMPVLGGYGHAHLEEDAVTPMANGGNVVDVGSLSETIRAVMGQLTVAPSRIALILPDIAGKVSFVRLANVPSRKTDLEELLRWKIGESIPYPVEDAQIAYSGGVAGVDGTREFVVSAVKREVVGEYEKACIEAGLNPGYVGLATFNVINTIASASLSDLRTANEIRDADWMLVNNASDNVSVAIIRKGQLIFFRSLTASSVTRLSDVIHQACMYYNDRMSGDSLTRAYLVNSMAINEDVGRTADDELVGLESTSVHVELLAARLKKRFCGSMEITTSLFEQLLAPLGVLVAAKQLTHA